jgi:signal transduction histidine kinase
VAHQATSLERRSKSLTSKPKLTRGYSTEPSLQEAIAALTSAFAIFDLCTDTLLYANPAFSSSFSADSSNSINLAQFRRIFGLHSQTIDANASESWQLTPFPYLKDHDAFHSASGRWYCLDASQVKVSGRDAVVLICKDATERMLADQKKNSQRQQLMFTSKVMSVGEMAATLAHELNQPIGSILNYLSGCIRRLEPATDVTNQLLEPLSEAHRQAQRAASIIDRIRQFVRSREPKPDSLDISEVVRTVLAIVEPDTRRSLISVETDLPSELPLVCADRVMIEQVLHNLAKNAIEAMQMHPGIAHSLKISATPGRHEAVEISVRDTGPGLPEHTKDQVFSPFFSTKSDGLGIGLNICRSLVEYHGGSLVFSNNREGGSTFSFTLPLVQPRGEFDHESS